MSRIINWDAVKRILKVRRDYRDRIASGFERIEGPWQITRGGRWQEKILEVAVSANGKDLWVRCGKPNPGDPA